jgi:hypothetical protein
MSLKILIFDINLCKCLNLEYSLDQSKTRGYLGMHHIIESFFIQSLYNINKLNKMSKIFCFYSLDIAVWQTLNNSKFYYYNIRYITQKSTLFYSIFYCIDVPNKSQH